MKTNAYQINLFEGVVNSFVRKWNSDLLLHDSSDDRIRSLEFHINSGDYFATAATVLELIKVDLPQANKRENELLERVIEDLLYLQRHYEIIQKRR